MAIYVRNELTASIIDVDIPNLNLSVFGLTYARGDCRVEFHLLQFVQFTL